MGGGSRGRVAIGFLANQGIKPDYVIDLSPEKRNTYLLGIQIISPKDLVDCLDEKYEYIVAAATDFYLFPYDQNLIYTTLYKECATFNIIGVFDIFRPEYNSNQYLPYSINAIDWYFNNQEKVFSALSFMEDETSENNFYEFLRTIMTGDMWRIEEGNVCDKYWGDGLYRLSEHEYWMNCGSAIGDSIFHFIRRVNKKFEHIDAIEGDVNLAKRLRRNLKYLPDELQNKITIRSEYLGGNSSKVNLDAVYRNIPLSLVDMDIEGAEESVISGATETLKNQCPVLAICIYHKMSDIVNIPLLIKSYNKDYHLYLRKYTTCSWNRGNSSELVLYAIPTQRLVRN